MGQIEINHTGSGGGVVLSSDGTDLLLGGSAIGGGASPSVDLYIANPSSATNPTAAGTNAVSIGSGSVASGEASFALLDGTASGQYAMAFNNYAVASAEKSISLGWLTDATATSAVAIGTGTQSSGSHSVALGQANATGADSFAAAIGSSSSLYGATGTGAIAMGYQAKATTQNSIAIGGETVASGFDNSICIGWQSTATSSRGAAVIGGRSNNSTGDYSTVLGGQSNTASGDHSVAMGYTSRASGNGSFALGTDAKATIKTQIAMSAGQFAAQGDAQGSTFILRSDTTDATAEAMTTNNSTAAADNQIVAATDTCITFSGTVVAMQNGAQAYGSWEIKGLLVNDGGTTTVPTSAITVINNSSSWGLALSADNTNNALTVQVTGEASHNIRWVANVQTAEVTYA
jgi:hypothetical protein